MNPLQRALIEKAGHDNGFEHVLPADQRSVGFGPAPGSSPGDDGDPAPAIPAISP